MPYNSGTGAYERRTTTVIDATPDGDTVAVAIDVKLDTAADDAVLDLNHHKTNGNHYPATSTHTDSRFLKQSPIGVVSWADGVVAADAALKDFSNVASGAIPNAKLANEPALKDFSNVADGAVPSAKLASGILPAQIADVAYVKTNILGTASQSSGVPTGAIVERGSNANGEYVRFADGTQICTLRTSVTDQSINSAVGALFTGTRAWTFPAVFSASPVVSFTARWGTGASWGSSADPNTTAVTLRFLDAESRATGTAVVMLATAIGRWF